MKKKHKSNNSSGDSTTLIGADSTFEGTYKGTESIWIEGEFKGTLEGTKNVYVHEGARVEADIWAQFVMVHGEVNGNITSEEEINIGATGRVKGDVATKSLTVVTGGCLNGQCRMAEKDGALEEHEPKGRFGSWKKKEAVQSGSKDESLLDLESVQSEPSEEEGVDLENVPTEDSSEQDTQERSAGL
ncbi:MAG: polymer-forming cytoskeletal protein [Desulfohalobiaceae bacterium]|nr:polymer-forming cytoskeletal protein [Desulfohalobiaceae bacterium]